MNFKDWLTEGSRWRQPEELNALNQRFGGNATDNRGQALSNVATNLGKENLPGLNKHLNSLSWQNDSETSNAFNNYEQPPYLYRGHKAEDPYLKNYSKTHASPWQSAAAGYGANVTSNTRIGSRFQTTPDQAYFTHSDLVKNNAVGTLPYFQQLNKQNGYETDINQDTHGGGERVLFRKGQVAPVNQQTYNQVYKPLMNTLPQTKKQNVKFGESMKSFRLWKEEREEKHLKSMLLRRLGLNPHSDDIDQIKIRDLDKDKLKDKIGTMGFDQDKITELTGWIDANLDSTLANLLSQMHEDDLDDSETDLPSSPAQLPKADPEMQTGMQPPPQPQFT